MGLGSFESVEGQSREGERGSLASVEGAVVSVPFVGMVQPADPGGWGASRRFRRLMSEEPAARPSLAGGASCETAEGAASRAWKGQSRERGRWGLACKAL